MKNNILLLTLLLSIIVLKAQDIPYFCTTSMEEYIELIDPVSVNNDEIWTEGNSYPIYFDFDFTIFDQTYSSLNIEAGGGITFPGYGFKNLFIYHTPFGGYLLKDKGITSSISNIDYEVSGVEGQYIIKIQWQNAGFVQWYSTSDTSDFVDFQVWIFQEDAHLELHFGLNQTNPGTYGFPEATSDPNPGPSIKYQYDDCSNVLSYFLAADNPSYDYFNFCDPNYSFIDGTPSEGITYTITPNENFVNISELDHKRISIFPNPALNYVQIEGITDFTSIETISLLDYQGNTVKEIRDFNIDESTITINIQELPMGIYFIKIYSAKEYILRKIIKTSI